MREISFLGNTYLNGGQMFAIFLFGLIWEGLSF